MLSNVAAPAVFKALVIVTALLFASLAGNAWQLKRAWISETEHAAEIERLQLEAQLAGAQVALDRSRELATEAQARLEEMQNAAGQITADLADQHREYVRRLKDIPPLPVGCGPGTLRVDAFNYREN